MACLFILCSISPLPSRLTYAGRRRVLTHDAAQLPSRSLTLPLLPSLPRVQGIDVFSRMMQLNYHGTLHTVKAVYDGMVTRKSGHIVFISSTMALMGGWVDGWCG